MNFVELSLSGPFQNLAQPILASQVLVRHPWIDTTIQALPMKSGTSIH